MLRRMSLVRTEVSEECIGYLIRDKSIGEPGTTLALTSNRSTLQRNAIVSVTVNVASISPILVTLMMESIRFSETSVLTRVTRRHISEDGIFHSHGRENLKSYTA
jgi:hypothetical protein